MSSYSEVNKCWNSFLWNLNAATAECFSLIQISHLGNQLEKCKNMNSLFTFATIVKPEYTDHPLDPPKTDRCSEMAYIRVEIILHISNNSVVWAGFRPVAETGGRYSKVVVTV